jgi:hypothetical protein
MLRLTYSLRRKIESRTETIVRARCFRQFFAWIEKNDIDIAYGEELGAYNAFPESIGDFSTHITWEQWRKESDQRKQEDERRRKDGNPRKGRRA